MEVYVDILKAVAEGRQKPTHVMHRANLPWTRMKKYLEFLITQNLLVEEKYEDGQIYALTPRGKAVLDYQRKIELCFSERKAVPTEIYAHTT